MANIRIRCKENLRNKIEYVFTTFLKRYSHIENGPDLIINFANGFSGFENEILFRSNSYTENYFSKFEEYPLKRVKYFEWYGDKIPFLFYSKADEIYQRVEKGMIIFNADIFFSAFYFLSHWQEYVSTERDPHNRFSGKSSIQRKLRISNYPLVNVYFEILEEILYREFGIILHKKKFGDKDFAIGISHDIDYIKKWSKGIIYREIIKHFILNFRKNNFEVRRDRFISFLKSFLSKNDPYQISIKKILEFENGNKMKSTFFFKTGGNSKHDFSYNIKNSFIKKLIDELKKNDFDIGLHPSYNAYNNLEMLKKEKEKLIKNYDLSNIGIRNHFLRYDISITPKIYNDLNFIFDSTLGFHDREGFRASYCFPYNIYDIKNDKVLDIIEIPLVGMDSTFQDYRMYSKEETMNSINKLINIIKRYDGVGVFLFHNTCFDEFDFKGWDKIFMDTVENSVQNGAYVGSLRQIYNFIK